MNKSSLNKKSVIRAASPREVTYYFKEQKSHLNCTGQWTDDVFPPNKNSLLGLDKNGKFIDPDSEADTDTIEMEIQPDNVVWKRARDIAELGPDAQLFVDGIDANDVQQGGLGTCYFLSAIAAITEFPSIIKDLLFKTKTTNEKGVYEIVLFIDGDWMIVPVDDWFPVEADTGSLKFTRTNGKELWVILLEKAWAKVNGGYLNVSGGNVVHSLFSLTGFPCNRVIHARERNAQKVWEAILEAETRDDIMCASTYGISDDDEGNKREQEYDELGLSPGHAYTLVGAKEAKYQGETLKLVLLRNPHGVFTGINTEWTGPWSDSDSRWNKELNEMFHHSNKEDGCFWMDFFDFFHHYEDTFFCDILYDGKLTYFKYKQEDTIFQPNVISFHVEQEQKMIVSVFRDTWRFVRQVKGHRYPFTLVICKYDPQTKEISNIDGKFFYDDYHEHIKTYKPGHYLAWVYYDKESCDGPILSEYVVRVASTEDFRTKEVGTDPEFKLLTEICLAGMRENYDENELKKPTVLKMDGDLKGTFIGCFYMQNNMNNSKLTLKGNLKNVHSYKVLGQWNKQPNYSVELNPGDANIIIALRKPPKKGRGKKPEFEITRTMTNSAVTGKGTLQLYDVSKYLIDISKIKKEYSQIVNINRDQFKETRAQNKADKTKTTTATTTDSKSGATVTRTETIRESDGGDRVVIQQSNATVSSTKYGGGNNYADSLYGQLDTNKYVGTTTKVVAYEGDNYNTTRVGSTGVRVVSEDNYGGRYVTGGTTTSSKVITYDGGNYGDSRVVTSSTNNRVVYEGNPGTYTQYGGDVNSRVVSNVTRQYGGNDDYEVVNVRQVSGNTTTSSTTHGGSSYGGTVYRRYEN
jgi:hypothetical protein